MGSIRIRILNSYSHSLSFEISRLPVTFRMGMGFNHKPLIPYRFDPISVPNIGNILISNCLYPYLSLAFRRFLSAFCFAMTLSSACLLVSASRCSECLFVFPSFNSCNQASKGQSGSLPNVSMCGDTRVELFGIPLEWKENPVNTAGHEPLSWCQSCRRQRITCLT